MINVVSPFNGAQFIGVFDDIDLPQSYCERMIEEFENLAASGSAVRGEDLKGVIRRKDLIVRFLYESSIDLVNETFYVLQQAVERYVDVHPGLAAMDIRANDVNVQRTPPKGGFHVFHSEASNLSDQILRVLVWTIYLNDLPDGEGCTEFLEQGVSVQPKAGRVVLFPADWTHTHRGNPTYKQEKYIATGWYLLNEYPFVFGGR